MTSLPTIYWRSILARLFSATLLLLGVLVMIFVLIDFSENSDDFADNGASAAQVFGTYYANYIPEMIRLVLPVAVFIATLFVAGRMSERLEFTTLKAAGVGLWRQLAPFLFFGIVTAAALSASDALLIPQSNLKRFDFERKYLSGRTERLETGVVFRQESEHSILNISFYDPLNQFGYQMQLIEYDGERISRWTKAARITWIDSLGIWRLQQVDQKVIDPQGYVHIREAGRDTTLGVFPSDLSRRTSDMYQLTYPEALDYLRSLDRLGIGHLLLPVVQFHGRLFYPLSVLTVIVIGFSISNSRIQGGRGFQVASGLILSFLYLTLMKVAEPFGAAGILAPEWAAFLPHGVFIAVAAGLLGAVRR